MSRLLRAMIAILLLVIAADAAAQQSSGAKDETKEASKSKTDVKRVEAGSVTINLPEGISRDQADAILNELRQIRQLLERQEAQLKSVVAPSMAPAPEPERVQLSVASTWNSIGRAEAPITIVEFTDYQCPYCKQFYTTTFTKIKKNYIDTGKVRWVTRDLPLQIHPYALKAAEASRCAGDQGKYWEMHDALLSSDAPPSDDVIKKLVAGLSLDLKNFQRCLDSEKYRAEVQKDAAEAITLQITHTPTFVVGKSAKGKLDGMRIQGAQPFAAFQTPIDVLLKD